AGVHGRKPDLSELASALAGVLGSTGPLPPIVSESDVVVISVRDARIPEIAQRLVDEKRLRPGQIVLHTSGNRPAAEVLAAARPPRRAAEAPAVRWRVRPTRRSRPGALARGGRPTGPAPPPGPPPAPGGGARPAPTWARARGGRPRPSTRIPPGATSCSCMNI